MRRLKRDPTVTPRDALATLAGYVAATGANRRNPSIYEALLVLTALVAPENTELVCTAHLIVDCDVCVDTTTCPKTGIHVQVCQHCRDDAEKLADLLRDAAERSLGAESEDRLRFIVNSMCSEANILYHDLWEETGGDPSRDDEPRYCTVCKEVLADVVAQNEHVCPNDAAGKECPYLYDGGKCPLGDRCPSLETEHARVS